MCSRQPSVTSVERTVPIQEQRSTFQTQTQTTCSQTIWRLISISVSQVWPSRYSSQRELLQLLHQYSGQWVTATVLFLTLAYLPTDFKHWLRTILAHALPDYRSVDTSNYSRLNRGQAQNGAILQSSQTLEHQHHQSHYIMDSSGSTQDHPPMSRSSDLAQLQGQRTRQEDSR